MATNTDGSLTLDLVLRSEGYRAGMDKVGRINDQKMRAMEARAEKAGKAIGKSLDSSALIASSVLDQALDMLGRTSRQAGQAKKPVQSAQDKVLAEWKTRQKELGEAWKSYREPLQDLSKLNEALLKNSSDKLDKALLNLSETGQLSLANVGKAAYADAARLASRQMTLMLLDGLFGWVASVGTEKPKVDDKAGKGQAKAGDDEKEQPSLQSQVFKQWLLQMNSVWGAYRAPLQDISGMTDELFRNASEKLEKSLFNFATSGKLSLSNFAKTVIDDVARIAARQLSMLALDGLFGWMNGKAGITEAQLASQKPYTSLLEKARAAAGTSGSGRSRGPGCRANAGSGDGCRRDGGHCFRADRGRFQGLGWRGFGRWQAGGQLGRTDGRLLGEPARPGAGRLGNDGHAVYQRLHQYGERPVHLCHHGQAVVQGFRRLGDPGYGADRRAAGDAADHRRHRRCGQRVLR
ncbi:phage tail tape measure C-terminal domain-containing protein [Pseudomonas aeruginosa]|nr:phage tail tape measure C-terminal domain-containing protein [Pseudomonas aeruginosa]